MTLSRRHIIQMGGNILYFFFILILMLDPTNSVFHFKEIIMVLLVGYNLVFFKPVLTYVPQILAVLAAVAISFSVAELLENPIDYGYALGVLKTLSMLVLLLWAPYYDLLKLAKRAGILLSIVILLIYISVCLSPVIEHGVYLFTKAHDDMLMMSERHFLGFTIYGVYYKSIISLSIVLYLFDHELFTASRRRFWIALGAVIVSAAFLVSGSRSPILLPFALFGIAAYQKLSGTRWLKYYLYPVIAILGILFLGFILVLAAEKGEESNAVKYGHLYSYAQLFFEHPEYLLFGQGVGTSFYSEGFHSMCVVTEWSYLELLRHYGLYAVLVLWLYFYPLFALWQHRRDDLSLGLLFAYSAYLFIAGTNPLLISSTGLLVVLMIYSYLSRIRTLDAQKC